MNDDELRAALTRRSSRSLSGDEKNDVIRAARLAAVQPRRRSFAPRLAGWAAGTAAVIVLVLVALPILLSPPLPVAGPSSSPIGERTAAPAMSIPASVSPTQAGGLKVYTAQELADMVGDPNWVGKTVLALARIAPTRHPPIDCVTGSPCSGFYLLDVSGQNLVTIGWRDATASDGVQYDDGGGYRWIKQLAFPDGEGVFAFAVRQNSAEYLGPAMRSADGLPLAVPDLVDAPSNATDDVFAVSAWLVQTSPAPCIPSDANNETPRPDDQSYWCGGSWLTATSESPNTLNADGTGSYRMVIDGGLHAQNGAYEEFAPSTGEDAQGFIPSKGVYLIRNAGCPPIVMGSCPVWRMVGRVDDTSGAPVASIPVEPSPSPSAPPSSGVTIHSIADLAGLVGDPTAVGTTVLTDLPAVAISHDPCSSPLGTPVNSCNQGNLDVPGGHIEVEVGIRDATAQDGAKFDDGSGYRWVKPLAWPMEAGVYAFGIGSNVLDYLGPARLSEEGQPLSVTNLSGSTSNPSDDVYVVSGWLTHTLEAPCAFPQEGLQSPMPDISSYYCGGSWLTDQAAAPPVSGLTIDGGLHVQNDAYNTFASDPQPADGGGYQPRQGIYLIRNAGCPEVVTGDCPVWRMVGRLDDVPAEAPSPSPSATPADQATPPTADGGTGISLDQAITIARENVGPEAQLWGYAAGTFRTVLGLTPEQGHVLQPPDNATWDSVVWGIQFTSTFDICPPPPPAGQTPYPCDSRPGISTVYLDYGTGAFLMNSGFSPNGPLPTPFFILPGDSPAP